MLDFGDLLVFTKVVETESLTKAGKLLGLPKSTISRRLSRLESHLGAKLVARNPRSVTVTAEGVIFSEACMRSLGVLKDGERALQLRRQEPQGVIRVAVASGLGETLLAPLLAEFLDAYPEARLVSVLSETPVAMMRGGFDLAITPGPLPDSGLISAKLGTSDCALFAAPAYADRKGLPQSPAELPRFDLLAEGSVERPGKWRLRRGGAQASIEFRPRLLSNSHGLRREAALSGAGIASLPAFLCKQDLAEGRLVAVLPDWKAADFSLFALFLDGKTLPARVRILVDFLVMRLRRQLSWELGACPEPTAPSTTLVA